MAWLIACEESQAVTLAMRRRGIEAYSCDVVACSGGHPEWHIQADVRTVLDREWSAVIAFPPCTHLCSSGARWWPAKRADGRQEWAAEFFRLFTRLSCPWAIENPVGIMSRLYRRPDQIIQPWQYGHGEVKTTCLWLHKLPPLKPTNIVAGRVQRSWLMPQSADRARLRSVTYAGVAEAMAEQWGRLVLGESIDLTRE